VRALATIVHKILDLFVEDGSLAALILVWIAFWGIARLSTLVLADRWGGVIFFAGLALILVENVLRTTRRRRLKPSE
jgi:hypothetical protein